VHLGRLAAVLALGLAVASGCAQHPAPDAAPTSETVAEFVAITADWSEAYVSCARAHGADARITPAGAIVSPVAEGRTVRNGLDAGCLEEVGAPPVAPPPSHAFLVGLYELLLEQSECLRQHGYVISEPPARDEWVETYDGDSWNPLMDVADVHGSNMEANGLCPQPDQVEAEALGFELLGTSR
jgi:hypothetical protein